MRIGPSSSGGFALDVRVIDQAQHRSMPWKNGLGTTTEIAIDPPDAALGSRFRWRLSIATVQSSGPFSAFPGCERTIMLVDGQGMDLAVGTDAPHRLDRPFEPFVFSGDVLADCRLIAGPVRDFNLMVDRSQLQSRMQVWRALSTEQSIDLVSADHVIHCFAGAADLACASAGWSHRLQASETAVFRRPDCARVSLQIAPVPGASPTLALMALAAPAGGQKVP